MSFFVSVIIPVYNGERFIEKAINSSIQQPEVSEVIIINDGSDDNTQSILEKLIKHEPKIKLLYHENKINKGRSASRNLGIKNAIEKYIAFLDADDYYLENRFKNDKKIFNANPKCDGVYNAIGVHFYRDATNIEKERLELTTITKKIEPEELFEVLISGKNGHFSIDGLTVKKEVFYSIGFFQEKLVVSEDTEIFRRMALKCRLETGLINKPLAVRGVHDYNVFNDQHLYTKYNIEMFESLIFWSSKNKISHSKIDLLLKWLWLLKYKEEKKLVKNIYYWAYLFMNNSSLLFSSLAIKYFPIVRLRKKLFPFLFS